MDVLQEDSGLLRHADGWIAPQDPDVYWARGNAWVTAATFEYLRVRLARGETDRFALRAVRRQLDGAIATQDPDSGRWWTIMNRPDETYEETSATALFAYSMARGWRYSFVGDEVLEPMWAAVDGVLDKIERDGAGVPVVTDVSGPTTVGALRNYQLVPLVDDINYGLGATLLMLVEVSGLERPQATP
jgi:unsaturated rhamnogalacturonyl hydrolase